MVHELKEVDNHCARTKLA